MKRLVRTFFDAAVMHWTLKKCNKKCDVILLIRTIIFLLSLCHRRGSCLFIRSSIKKTNVSISGNKMLKETIR